MTQSKSDSGPDLRRLKGNKKPTICETQKISSFVIKKPSLLGDLTYFNKVKFNGNFKSCSKIELNNRFVAMATRDLQTLNLKFDQVMFNNLVFTWERNFEVMFGIFAVLVT